MSTRVAAIVEVTGVEEMERRLVELVEQVEREKEKTKDTFQQLHSMLVVREQRLLRELDEVVVEAGQELKEKREVLQELQRAKESAERELTKKKLKRVLEKNLKTLENEIKEELSQPLSVMWVEVERKREQLEQSIAELCKVVKMKERPLRIEVLYHEETDYYEYKCPYKLSIHSLSHPYPRPVPPPELHAHSKTSVEVPIYLVRAVTRNAGDKWEITEKDLDIMDKIGKGNFGYVYKGYIRSRSSHVAIKMCKSDALADQDEFLREAEILKQYRHPNIVEFIGVSQQADSICIIMELMSGGDFLTFLRNKAIREKKHILSHMVLDVAEGMTYLSSKDCVHRDLAARNCLIGKGKSLKISDFGMSRQLSEGEYQMSTANEPLPIKWTAPEALHKGLYTCQSDVWSYGILLWETFSCGSTPYPGMDSKTTIEKLETGFRLPAPTGTPAPVYELMRQCWEYNSLDRPRFPQIVCALQSTTQELRSKNV